MKHLKMFRKGWVGILVCGLAVFTNSVQADEPCVDPTEYADLQVLIEGGQTSGGLEYRGLKDLKDDVDALRANVEAAGCNQSALEGHFATSLSLEAQAHAHMQAAIDIAVASTKRTEVFVKQFTLVVQWHMKVVASITIVNSLIIEIWEECELADGGAGWETLQTHAAVFNAYREVALARVNDLTPGDPDYPGNEDELDVLFGESLAEQQVVLDQAVVANTYAQGQAPSLYIMKWVVIVGHWHLKLVHFHAIIGVAVIDIYERFVLVGFPPDQDVIAVVDDHISALKTMEATADGYADAVFAGPPCPTLQTNFDGALALEYNGTPAGHAIAELRGALTEADTILRPSMFLQKRVVIVEMWFQLVVVDVSITKWLVIFWEEYLDCPQPAELEPEIAELLTRRANLQQDDEEADVLVEQAEGSTPYNSDPIWHSGLQKELESLDELQAGVQTVQDTSWPRSELLKKAIGIVEIWHVRVVIEISIVKVVIIRVREWGIPAVTTWGLAVMMLLCLTAGTIIIHRRRRLAMA